MKRGGPLPRRTPLAATPKPCCGRSLCSCGVPPKLKRTRLNPLNVARADLKYERNFGDWSDVIRAMPCWWCERDGPNDPAHARPRGMGGAGGDKTDLLPMCRACHDLYDDYKLGVDHDQAIADANALYAMFHSGDGGANE